MKKKPHKAGSRIFLEDTGASGPYTGWDRYARALGDVFSFLGISRSVTELLAFGGDAFHICFPSDAEALAEWFIPLDSAAQMAASAGFAGHWLHHGHEQELVEHLDPTEQSCLMEGIFEQIISEIDAGRPVLLQGGIYGLAEAAFVMIGYDQQRREFCFANKNGLPEWTRLYGNDNSAATSGYWQGTVRGSVRASFYGGILVNPVFCLGHTVPRPEERDHLIHALKQAVNLHHAAPVTISSPQPFTCTFGDLAYHRWAEAIAPSTAAATLQATSRNQSFMIDSLITGRLAAADFCRRAAKGLTDAANELFTAAEAYSNEAELASRFRLDNHVAPDPSEIWQLQDFERAAILNIQGALRTLAGTEQDGSRIFVRDVPELVPGQGKDCFFAGALEAALSATEHPVDYRDIMCLSGLATRVNWYVGTRVGLPRWDRSCAIGERPSSHQPLQKATGWRFRPIIRRGWPDMTEFVPLLTAAVDAGQPSPCYIQAPRMGLVFGYADQGRTLLCRSYDAPGETLELPMEQLGWLIFLIDHHTSPPPPEESYLETIRLILRQWYSPAEVTPGGELLSGMAAYRRWIADLDRVDKLDDDEQKLLFGVNWFVFHELADARLQIGPFLRNGSRLLPAAAQSELEIAVQAYDQVTQWARSAYEMQDAFIGPWTHLTAKAWTTTVRQREIQLLIEMSKVEQAAIERLEAVLKICRGNTWAREQLAALEQWSNLFGALDDCIRAADRDPVFFALLHKQVALSTPSPFIIDMRQSIAQLNPADQHYGDQIDTLMASLAAGQFVRPWPDGTTPGRRHRVKQLAQAMEHWIWGKTQAEAKRAGVGESAVDEIYRLLGDFDASKKRPIAMTIQKLRTGKLPENLQERHDSSPSAPLAAQLTQNIDDLEIQRWTFEHNLKILLTSIGQKRVLAPWGAADGPIPWHGIQALNPSVKPRMQAAIDELQMWLENDAEPTSQLGDRNDYAGKAWLAHCLLICLQYHIAGQF